MAKGRILLVEDDNALAELLFYNLKREDFEVAHTADGEDAMLLARENPPDLVLLDWMIEGVSGIEVCRRLRRPPATANVPIRSEARRVGKECVSTFQSRGATYPYKKKQKYDI